MFGRRRRRGLLATAPGSLAWRLKRDNPRKLGKAEYVAELRAQDRLLAVAGEPVDDFASVREMIQTSYGRGQRIRQERLSAPLDKDQAIAAFERQMAREAARRR